MLEAPAGYALTLMLAIVVLTESTPTIQPKDAVPASNRSDELKLMTIRTAVLPELTNTFAIERAPTDVTETPSWLSTHFYDVISEHDSTTELLATEKLLISGFSTETTAIMDTSAELAPSEPTDGNIFTMSVTTESETLSMSTMDTYEIVSCEFPTIAGGTSNSWTATLLDDTTAMTYTPTATDWSQTLEPHTSTIKTLSDVSTTVTAITLTITTPAREGTPTTAVYHHSEIPNTDIISTISGADTATKTSSAITASVSTREITLTPVYSTSYPISTVAAPKPLPTTVLPTSAPSTKEQTALPEPVMTTKATPLITLSTTTTAAPTFSVKPTQAVIDTNPTTVQQRTTAVRISSQIVDQALANLEQKNLSVDTVASVASQVANLTTHAEELSVTSALKATKIVADISDLILTNNFTEELYPVPKLIGQIAAGLMNLNSTVLATVESQSSVSVQKSLETSLSALALAALQNGSAIKEDFLRLQDENLAFQVVINSSISGIRISSASSLRDTPIELVPYENSSTTKASKESTSETLVQIASSVANRPKAFLVYSNAKLFQAKGGSQPDSSGRVVSAQLPGLSVQAPELIKIVFPAMLNNSERKCGYWNYTEKIWSTEGCNVALQNNDSVTCVCEHLTNFAVLLAVRSVPPIIELDILSTIGLGLSSLSLAAVVITFLALRKMRHTVSQKVLFNLALSLLALDLLFLFGIDKTSPRNGCIAIAALLHYFLLTSFMWMLMESILQYLRFVKVLGTYIPRFLLKTAIPAWGAPAVIVAIVSGVDIGLYNGGENLYCMAQKEVIYYAVLLPIGLILVINWSIFIVVLRSFCCQRRLSYQSKRPESSLAKLHAQAGVAVCTLLGLTWVFGFLTAIPDVATSIAFQWLFCICNTLQGFIIFIFHCLREKAVRRELRRFCCRKGLLAATSLSEDNSSASRTASSAMSRNQSVSLATVSSSSVGGLSFLTFRTGFYSVDAAEGPKRLSSENP